MALLIFFMGVGDGYCHEIRRRPSPEGGNGSKPTNGVGNIYIYILYNIYIYIYIYIDFRTGKKTYYRDGSYIDGGTSC